MANPLFFLCLILCFLISFTISQPLFLPLTHFLSKTQYPTTHHLLKATAASSSARFNRHHHKKSKKQQRQVSLPLSPGSDYTLTLTIGAHPPHSTVSLYLDTGSDVVWFPCHPFECILCEGKSEFPPAPINISASATRVSCQSPECSAAHNNFPNSDLCVMSKCPLDQIEVSECGSYSCPSFYYAYGDGSFVAKLHTDTVSSNSLVLRNFTFGCAHESLGEPVGVAGFGRGILSLPAQLSTVNPQLGNRFSYCLVSHSFNSDKVRRPSPLILGRYKEKKAPNTDGLAQFVYTDMLDNPKHQYFYTVGLEGISVGRVNIPAPAMLKKVDSDGYGGMVVDSGTTFTMLPEKFYNQIVAEFDRRVGRVYKRATEVEDNTGLSPCYYGDAKLAMNVPSVTLRFVGNGSSVMLPKRNYFHEYVDDTDGVKGKRNVGCLMLMNGGDEEELSGGPGATLGNYQQQGFEVVYDLEEKKVGFAKRQCASLWESLNQN
ncbi:hypothetical protein ACFE04_028328 [Oxalis oulophora]